MKHFFKCLVILGILTCGISKVSAQYYSLSSNMLGLATGNLNIEISATAGRKWSIHLPVNYNPFTYNFISENAKMQNLTTQPGIRYWFCESYMRGFIGLHATASRYHLGWDKLSKYRYDGWATGGGLSLGYAKMLAKRWNLEFEVAADVLYADYDKYECRVCGFLSAREKKVLVAPTKASISIVYLF